MKKSTPIILAALALAACHPSAPAPAAADTAATATEMPQADVLIEEVPAATAAAPRPRKSTTPKANTPKATGKAETIYVETEGAQGRVWGHVTLRGDRGTGTIHDWDENTLAVSVTRHGNELFAVDQNSRQYVFKLKQNKTQE